VPIGDVSGLLLAAAIVGAMLALLGLGIWIGLALIGVSLVAMVFGSTRMPGEAMATTIFGSLSSWTLTSLPLFIWMGEILFRSKISESMFRGLAPWLGPLPGRLLQVNVVGSAIFAAVSGSSAATCATIGKITIPELEKRGYPEEMVVGSLAGAGTLGLLIPPSIIMIVYGVTADVSINKLFIGGVVPGVVLALLFMVYAGARRPDPAERRSRGLRRTAARERRADAGGAADRGGAGFDLRRLRDRDRVCRAGRAGRAAPVGCPRRIRMAQLRCHDHGSDEDDDDDHADPCRFVVPHDRNGLHRHSP
jgi:hypothetical protein